MLLSRGGELGRGPQGSTGAITRMARAGSRKVGRLRVHRHNRVVDTLEGSGRFFGFRSAALQLCEQLPLVAPAHQIKLDRLHLAAVGALAAIEHQ